MHDHVPEVVKYGQGSIITDQYLYCVAYSLCDGVVFSTHNQLT